MAEPARVSQPRPGGRPATHDEASAWSAPERS